MLTRLMFGGGGTAQVLIIQAGQQFITSGRSYYGYNETSSPAYGSLTPKYIEYQGTQYEIAAFYTTPYGISLLIFQNNVILPATTIVIEVNGKKYTMVKNEDTGSFRIRDNIFTDTSTYIIKILSIE